MECCRPIRAPIQSQNARNSANGEPPDCHSSGVPSTKFPLLPIKSQNAREAPHALHVREVDQLVLQDLVGRLRAVDHLPLRVVPHDGRAAEALQNADLNLLRTERDEPIKPAAKALHVLPRQADDEVRVHVDAGVLAQVAQVIRELRVDSAGG